MTARPSDFAGLLLLTAILGCASVSERISEDRERMQETLGERLGVESQIPASTEDDGALSSEICPLLCDGLTEEEAIKIVFLNQRGVRAELEELGIAGAELVQAGLLTNPVFHADAKFFDSGTEIEMGVAQSFLDLFYRPLRKAHAESEFSAAQAFVAAKVIGIVFEVRRSFVALKAAQQIAAMRGQALQAAQANFDLMEDLHEAGNVTDSQRTVEEIALARAKMQFAAAEAAVYEEKESLNVRLGLWGEEAQWQVEDKMDENPVGGFAWENLESRAVTASFDLGHQRAHAQAAAQSAGLRSWEGWFGDGEIGLVAKREADGEWGVGPSFSLPIPLFTQGQARVAGEQARLRQLLYRYTESAVQIRSAARTFRERLIALQSRVEYLRKVYLPLQLRLVRETLQNYNAMQIGAFDVLSARQQQIDAEKEYLETLRDAWIARIDLEELLAGRFHPSRVSALPMPPCGHENANTRKKGH